MIIYLGLEPNQTSDETNLLLLEQKKAKLQDQLKISEKIKNEDQKQELEQLKLGSQKVNTLDKLDLRKHSLKLSFTISSKLI